MFKKTKHTTMNISDIRLPHWNSTCYIVAPDYAQLKSSIEKFGMLHPVTVSKNGTLIDGFHRLAVNQELGINEVDVISVEVDDVESILLHIDLNRYRGIVIAKNLSHLITNLLNSGRYEYDELRKRMKLTREEFDVLADGTLIKMRKIKQHTYSPAWVPIESSAGEDIKIERPTGHKEQV